jgi:hypothetical protein
MKGETERETAGVAFLKSALQIPLSDRAAVTRTTFVMYRPV